MIPADAVKAVPGGIEIHVVNVISPMSIDEIPDDYLSMIDHIEVTVDGKGISDEQKKLITIGYDGVKYGANNLKEAIGKTIPVGATLILFAPITGVKKGEEHEIRILVKLDNPIDIVFTRTVQ